MRFFRRRPPQPPEPFDARRWTWRCHDRLRRQYGAAAHPPGQARPLTIAQLLRLLHAVRGEFGP